MSLHCSVCGKNVSTEVPDGTIVRAFIQCPDCISDGKKYCWSDLFDAAIKVPRTNELMTTDEFAMEIEKQLSQNSKENEVRE